MNDEGLAALEQTILKRLHGSDKDRGLYIELAGARDWESFVRAKGVIFAYEEVLKDIRELVRMMNEPPQQRRA